MLIMMRETDGGSVKMTLREWMTVWFETYSKPLIRPSTADLYYNSMKNHIFPNIGNIALENLRSLDIQQMYNQMRTSGRVRKAKNDMGHGLSVRTVRNTHSLLRQCLEQAVHERLVPFNPANGCKVPPGEKREMKVMLPEDIGRYLKTAAEYGVLPMLFLALSSGLRRGELLALHWKDLDINNLTISVSKQVMGRNGCLIVSTPKTQNSTRIVAISEQTAEILTSQHAKHGDNIYMFPSPVTGEMYHPDSIGRLHKKILAKAGMEKIRFHDLRHTFATLALQNGVDIKTLSNILGHHSAGFTLDTYGHVTQKMKRDAAVKVGNFLLEATAAI